MKQCKSERQSDVRQQACHYLIRSRPWPREWYQKNVSGWAPSHSLKIIRRLEQDVFPWIGSKPVASIRPMELRSLLKRVEQPRLRGALTPWKPEHYATLTDARDVSRLLRDIEAYEGGFITKCATKLSPMLFVRPGELRQAEWSEINLDAAEWRIPAAKMKGRSTLSAAIHSSRMIEVLQS